MIYVSSACVKALTIKESVEKLASLGYKNIELSGGTMFYSGISKDLIELQKRFRLNLLCHNYFPPPQTDFVLNLASLDKNIQKKSENHIKNSLDLTRKLGAKKFALHAGFLIDFSGDEIGNRVFKRELYPFDEALSVFTESLKRLQNHADDLELFVENNVLSQSNYSTFNNNNPFLFTDYEGYLDISNEVQIKPLLDVGHLYVSCTVLGINFIENLSLLNSETTYLHISDNDGFSDLNKGLNPTGEIYKSLKNINLKNKTVTLEVYDGENSLNESCNLLKGLN